MNIKDFKLDLVSFKSFMIFGSYIRQKCASKVEKDSRYFRLERV